MSYHKFTNLGQKLNSDLAGKVMKGVIDYDLMDKKCNCNVLFKMEGWRAGVSRYFWGFYVRTIVRYLLIWPTKDTRGNPFDTGFVTA